MLTVAYDGTNYNGWQWQPQGVTIEGVLNRELSRLLKEDIHVQGTSRTDAGVHSLGNLCIFDTETRIPPEKLCLALNQSLPDDLVTVASREVPLKEAIRTAPFWCILLTIFFYNATWNMLNPIIRPLGEERALSSALALTCVSLTGVFNAAGRFGMSALSDKLGRVETNVILCVVTIVCALLLMFVGSYAYIVVVLITAFAFGGPSAINPATTTDFFGAKYSGTNYGVAMLSLGFSSIIFNAISNALVKATGAYTVTFIIGAVTAAITIVLQLIIKSSLKKQRS